MRKLLLGFLLLLIAIWLGLKMHQDSGYVLITFAKWSIETSVWVAGLILLLIFILFHFLLKFIAYGKNLPSKLSRWFFIRDLKRAQHFTQVALCQMAEEKWTQAEYYFNKATFSHIPLVNYLGTAIAAHFQGFEEKSDTYLQQALHKVPGAPIIVGLTRARLQMHSAQWQLALVTLTNLQTLLPTHPAILRLLQEVLFELRDWSSLEKIFPYLQKHNILPVEKLNLVGETLYVGLLHHAASQENSALLKKTWKKIPTIWQENGTVIKTYMNLLISLQETESAVRLIERTLKKGWYADLVLAYSSITSPQPYRQLQQAEMWLQPYPQRPELLFCLGRLCIRERLWGKAREYLLQNLSIKPTAATYQALGEIAEASNDKETALKYYRHAALFYQNYCHCER